MQKIQLCDYIIIVGYTLKKIQTKQNTIVLVFILYRQSVVKKDAKVARFSFIS